ncbi:MAG TPA: hypothetical protein VGC26_03310 [Afipia sp.]
MRKFPLTFTVAAAMITNAAFAAEIPIPPRPSQTSKTLPVQANQPHCGRWTDECVTCTRGADGEAPTCSNTGIACQPKAIRCLSGEIQQGEKPK